MTTHTETAAGVRGVSRRMGQHETASPGAVDPAGPAGQPGIASAAGLPRNPGEAEQLVLLKPTPHRDEPAWRIAIDGGPLAFHDARCWLDPRHHSGDPCSWPLEAP